MSKEKDKQPIEDINVEEVMVNEILDKKEANEDSIENAEEEKPPIENNRIAELEDALSKEKDNYLRAVAEMENLKKRKNQEIENTRKFSNEKLILEFLPVLDNFDRAKTHLATLESVDEKVMEGFNMISTQFESTMSKLNVTAIDALNKKFNPHEHQAMLSEESKEVEPDTIIRVLQSGYKLNERVIRPSMVVVSK